MELDHGARTSDTSPHLLDVYGDQWRTPLRDYARGFYDMERTGGFEFYRVRRAPLPVVVLERHGSVGGTDVGGGWQEWMVDDPLHWYAMRERVEQVQPGRLLVAGLGLGIMLRHATRRNDLTDITVVELDPAVIDLIGVTLPADPRVTIVQGDYYAHIARLAPEDWPDAVLWDLAVGTPTETREAFMRARIYHAVHLPGVPLHRFGLKGPDPLGT